MAYFQIGSLTVPSVWLSVILALAGTALIGRYVLKQNTDLLWNGFFYYVLIWKISYIFFYFDLFRQSPFSLLYFHGGIKGHFLALFFLAVYFFIVRKKDRKANKGALSQFLLFFAGYEIFSAMFEKQFTCSILYMILFIGIIFFLFYLNKKGKELTKDYFLLFVAASFLLLSIFRPLFSLESLSFLWLGMVIYFFQNK